MGRVTAGRTGPGRSEVPAWLFSDHREHREVSQDTGDLSGRPCCHATLTSKTEVCSSPGSCVAAPLAQFHLETTKRQGQAGGLGQAGATRGCGQRRGRQPQGHQTWMELFLHLSVGSPGSGRLTAPFPASPTTALAWGSHAAPALRPHLVCAGILSAGNTPHSPLNFL